MGQSENCKEMKDAAPQREASAYFDLTHCRIRHFETKLLRGNSDATCLHRNYERKM